MSRQDKIKSAARSDAAKETNAARADKRRELEVWFREHHTTSLSSNVVSDNDFVDVEETLVGEFGENAIDGDMHLVVT